MQEKLEKAEKAWEGAPVHIRMMAGAYVGPILEVLDAFITEVKAARRDLDVLKEMVEKNVR